MFEIEWVCPIGRRLGNGFLFVMTTLFNVGTEYRGEANVDVGDMVRVPRCCLRAKQMRLSDVIDVQGRYLTITKLPQP